MLRFSSAAVAPDVNSLFAVGVAVVAAENWELGKGCCRRVAACCCGEASHDLKRRSVLLFTKLLFLCFFL